MIIHVYDSFDHPDLDPGAWNELLSVSALTNTVFQTFEWLKSWWDSLNRGSRLCIVTAWENGSLCGIAPLCISKDGRQRVLKFVSDRNSDYCDFIAAENWEIFIEKVFNFLFENIGEWEVIRFSNIPETSPSLAAIKRIGGRHNKNLMTVSSIKCYALATDNSSSFAREVLRKKTLRRRYNYFRKKGELRFNIITSEEELEKYLPVFFDQHIEQWRSLNDPSLFNNRDCIQFYRDMAPAMLKNNWLLFSFLDFNGEPIAFHLGFRHNRHMTWYKPSYDIMYSKRSPGLVHLKYLIEYCLKEDIDIFDLTIGDESYKSRFSDKISENYTVEIYKTFSGYLLVSSKLKLRKLIKRLVRRA